MTEGPLTLDVNERCTLLMALYERQEFLRANLDRVEPSIAELGDEELERHSEHKVNAFDEISALAIKLGGDPTDYLFGAIALRRGGSEG